MIEMEVEDATQAKEQVVILQVAITEDDFNQFILNKPFNPLILAIGLDKLNQDDLSEFQNHLSGALNVLLNNRLKEIADKLNGIQDVYEESEE